MLSFVVVATSLVLSVSAAVTPTEPSPGRDFQPGGQCEITWLPDTTGTWKNTYIQLMTGSNDDMRHLATVYHFDGTNPALTSYTYTCPDVNPHSAIYFYQFTSEATLAGTDEIQWTGRFSISNGDLVPPTEITGDVAWGIGTLVDPSFGTPPPPTAPGGSGTVPPPDQGASDTATNTPAAPTQQPPAGGNGPSGTTTGQGSGNNDGAPATTANGGHAMPGAGSNTRTTRDPSQPSVTNTPTPPGDAAVSMRGPASALFAAGVIAAVLL